MRASDGGTPPRTDTTIVTVPVIRNLEKPVFDPVQYEVECLPETFAVGETLATVTATDEDRRVCANAGRPVLCVLYQFVSALCLKMLFGDL